MKIAFTGYSGFIASSIQKQWGASEHEFYKLKRDQSDKEWSDILLKADVIINLAGAPVIQRWTQKNKHAILNSRVNTTRRVVSLLNKMKIETQKLLISASAIGIYPDTGDQVYDESSSETGSGFLSDVVQQWETEAKQLNGEKVRLVIARIGIVMGAEGGMLKKTAPLFKLGLGGKIASGKQAMSFIHINDIVRAFDFFITQETTTGVYNLVAPELTTNAAFTKAMGRILRRPVLFPVPGIALRLIYGEAAAILINGERVRPQHLIDDEFTFQYANIHDVLKSIF